MQVFFIVQNKQSTYTQNIMKGWSKIMNNEFNTKMQQLYELLCDINATAPSKNLNTAYENLFSRVNDWDRKSVV